jgi:carboxy-cis,cis-muconate cyclase
MNEVLQHTFESPQNLTLHDTNHYILTGSFRSLSIFLLAFSPSKRALTKVKRFPGEFGPHQYLAKVNYGTRRDAIFGETKEMRIYGTSWAWPPMLHCWGLTSTPGGDWNAWNIGQAPICKTTSVRRLFVLIIFIK